MPDMPKTFRPPHARTTQERKRDHDMRRRRNQPWRKWYATKAWQAIRSRQLREHPLCERCWQEGQTTEATIVNHIGGHGGDYERFFNGSVESLCKPHHDIDVQREEAEARRLRAPWCAMCGGDCLKPDEHGF